MTTDQTDGLQTNISFVIIIKDRNAWMGPRIRIGNQNQTANYKVPPHFGIFIHKFP